MTLDTVTLSRLQFAFTIGYHIVWPAYSIGIAGFIVLLNALWLRTGKTVYRDLMRFWIRLSWKEDLSGSFYLEKRELVGACICFLAPWWRSALCSARFGC